MTTALDSVRYNFGLAGEEVAAMVDALEVAVSERDARIAKLEDRRCEICGYAEHHREHTGCLRVLVDEQAARIKELEEINRLLNLATETIGRSCKRKEEEISRLREVLAKCGVSLTGMKDWFDAEENHGSTTFYERVEMCNAVQINTTEALAAIKEIEHD